MFGRAGSFALTAVWLLVISPAPALADEPTNSPLAGSYSGTFTFRSANPRFPNGGGTVTLMTIAADGKVSGKFSDAMGNRGEFSGSVDDDGAIKYTIEFPTQTYVVKGIVVKTKKGSLKGTLTQYAGKEQPVGTVEFDLPPK